MIVCMPHYNRPARLENSIRAYESLYDDIELSICDDRSDPPLVLPQSRLKITLTRIDGTAEPRNPCVPMNRAVNASDNDIIVLTNPEVEHREPVFDKMRAALQRRSDYVIAACRCAISGRWEAHSGMRWRNRHPLPPLAGFHFCAMLHRDLWRAAGGFDEDYRDGQGYEDNDWLWRLENVGANFIPLDDCIVYHYPSDVLWGKGGAARNRARLRNRWENKWNL